MDEGTGGGSGNARCRRRRGGHTQVGPRTLTGRWVGIDRRHSSGQHPARAFGDRCRCRLARRCRSPAGLGIQERQGLLSLRGEGRKGPEPHRITLLGLHPRCRIRTRADRRSQWCSPWVNEGPRAAWRRRKWRRAPRRRPGADFGTGFSAVRGGLMPLGGQEGLGTIWHARNAGSFVGDPISGTSDELRRKTAEAADFYARFRVTVRTPYRPLRKDEAAAGHMHHTGRN